MNLFYEEAAKGKFSLSLHAMRGIAAVIVLFHHLQNALTRNLVHEEYSVLFNGSGAVTFFFVLSGLVVGASIAKSPVNIRNCIEYGIRRFFRIMPLMFFVVSFGGFYIFFIEPHMPYKFLPESYGELTIAKLISGYIGYSMKPNPPIWTIFVEIVASAALPFMVVTGVKRIYVFLTFCVLLLFASFDLGLQHHWNFYMIDFYLGLSILWWGRPFIERIKTINIKVFWAGIVVTFLIFYLPRLLFSYKYGDFRFNLIEIIPVAIICASAYYLPERFKFFETPPFRYLGDISFSLYLTHSLIFELFLNFLAIFFPLLAANVWLMLIPMTFIAIPVSFVIATACYHYIELPFIEHGKKAVSFYRRKFVAS